MRSVELRLSKAIVRMMFRPGFRSVINYLNDFLVIGKTCEECQQGLITLIRLLLLLGFNIVGKSDLTHSTSYFSWSIVPLYLKLSKHHV